MSSEYEPLRWCPCEPGNDDPDCSTHSERAREQAAISLIFTNTTGQSYEVLDSPELIPPERLLTAAPGPWLSCHIRNEIGQREHIACTPDELSIR